MFERLLKLEEIRDDSLFLWGSRQTGKSTLLKALFPNERLYDLLKTNKIYDQRQFKRHEGSESLWRRIPTSKTGDGGLGGTSPKVQWHRDMAGRTVPSKVVGQRGIPFIPGFICLEPGMVHSNNHFHTGTTSIDTPAVLMISSSSMVTIIMRWRLNVLFIFINAPVSRSLVS